MSSVIETAIFAISPITILLFIASSFVRGKYLVQLIYRLPLFKFVLRRFLCLMWKYQNTGNSRQVMEISSWLRQKKTSPSWIF